MLLLFHYRVMLHSCIFSLFLFRLRESLKVLVMFFLKNHPFSVTKCEMFETSWNANVKYKWKWLTWLNRSMASSLYVFACLKWVNTSQRLTVYPWIRLNRATHFAHTSSNVCGSDICHFIYSKDEFPKFIEFSCIIYYSRTQFYYTMNKSRDGLVGAQIQNPN